MLLHYLGKLKKFKFGENYTVLVKTRFISITFISVYTVHKPATFQCCNFTEYATLNHGTRPNHGTDFRRIDHQCVILLPAQQSAVNNPDHVSTYLLT